MAETKKTKKPNIRLIRKIFGFNHNLISITLEEANNHLVFKFLDTPFGCPNRQEIDYFEIINNQYDYNAFDAFAYRCINGFDSESMTDEEIVTHGDQLCRSILKLLKKRPFTELIAQAQNKIQKIMIIKGTEHHMIQGNGYSFASPLLH